MKQQLMRCAVYIRVSSDEQAKFGDSLRDQRERCLEYINRHENMIFQDIYIDDGVSGQKLDRGEFERLLENVRNDQIDLIFFTKLDRWFRNLRHYLNTQAVLEAHNTAWTAIDQPYYDTSTPHGRAFVAQSMMWAELEAQNDGVRITDVFKNKVKYGEVITGKVPRGYRIQDKHLVLSEEAPAILDSIRYFIKTNSLSGTVKYMQNQHGISMSLQNLKDSILKNTKYIGRYRDNLNYCPALISEEEFNQIQKILDNKQIVRSSQKYPYIFSGLLVCSDCGYKMSGCKINHVTHSKNGIRRYKYPAYECKQYRAYKRCSNGGEIRESRIEEFMLSHIRSAVENYIADYQEAGRKTVDNRTQKSAINKKLDRLKDLYLNEIISLDEYKRDRAQYLAALEELPDFQEPPADLTKIQSLLHCDFEQVYTSFTNPEKRRFWRSIIKEIHVSKSVNRHRDYTIIF
ncbi:recombinase family protein [Clostridium sp. AM58-1XD]|uniref:recombinase family protein n=1 Tax=Clostridium sp. AM58-1XD TaxID=2292307 RepID=UPI000E51BCE0|nr:recombinase family protein [Clostridium sp. AM58-1XD]RGZ00184.1 recombinase family protein [Clostridium sp. AM58-1XD]